MEYSRWIFIHKSIITVSDKTMVYKKGAFTAGQKQIMVNAEKRAKKILDTRAYYGNVEKATCAYVKSTF